MTYNFETTETYNNNSLTNTINGYTHNGSAVNGNLYNGNISRMVTALYDNNQNMLPSLARAFFYDQLNRIKAVKTFDVAAPSTATGSLSVSTTANDNYYEDFSYDFNGNLTSLNRYGLNNGTKTKMDEFQYKYLKVNNHLYNNRLMNVNDNTALTNNYTAPGYEDIDNQDYNTTVVIGTGDEAIDLQMELNYEYDNIGNLAKNRQDEIERIEWTVYGKVHKVIRTATSSKVDLEYIYNPFGQRVGKIVKPHGSSSTQWVYTFYELDASGNTMAVYEKSHPAQTNTDQLLLNEQYLYGASRVGVYKPGIDMLTATATANSAERVLGKKAYQVSNHLGNVLQTISDRKLNLATNEYHSAEYFEASAQASTTTAYEGIASDKIYGPYPQSNFVFSKGSERKQIEFGDYISAGIFSKAGSGTNLGQLVLSITDANGATVGWIAQGLTNGTTDFSQTQKNITFSTGSLNTTGTAPYYITCFTWNTSTVPVYVDYLTVDIIHHGSLQELAGYQPEILSSSDYYVHHGAMPGRTFNDVQYRYGGANGQEKDFEIASGMYTAEFWEYDSRIGRRWNTDPITYPHQSPYATFNNNPIYFADPSGLEGTNGGDDKKKAGEGVNGKGTATTPVVLDEVEITAKQPPPIVVLGTGPDRNSTNVGESTSVTIYTHDGISPPEKHWFGFRFHGGMGGMFGEGTGADNAPHLPSKGIIFTFDIFVDEITKLLQMQKSLETLQSKPSAPKTMGGEIKKIINDIADQRKKIEGMFTKKTTKEMMEYLEKNAAETTDPIIKELKEDLIKAYFGQKTTKTILEPTSSKITESKIQNTQQDASKAPVVNFDNDTTIITTEGYQNGTNVKDISTYDKEEFKKKGRDAKIKSNTRIRF